MSKLHSATDSVRELLAILAVGLALSTVGYAYCEGKSIWDSFWWAVITSGTIGYGDQFPVTVGGRIVGILLIALMVLLVLPLITARMASYLIVNNDAFTHTEQEQIKNDLREIRKLCENGKTYE